MAVTVASCRAYTADLLESWTDDEITSALETELAQQTIRCTWSLPKPADLEEALERRVMVNLAWRSRAFSAEVLGDAEIAVNLPANDPIVKRLEAPYRKVRLGW